MSRKNKKQRKRRDRLFALHPFCHWCGVELVMVVGPKVKHFPANAATLDHRYGRLDPRRGKRPNATEDEQSVLACRGCNEARGRQDQANAGLEELRRRAKRHPSATARP